MKNRILASVLSLAMILQISPVTAFANSAADTKPSNTKEITAFETLSEDVTAQEITLGSEETPNLPETIKATVTTTTWEEVVTPPASSEGTTTPPASSEDATTPPASSEGATAPPASSEGATTPPTSSEGATTPPASSEGEKDLNPLSAAANAVLSVLSVKAYAAEPSATPSGSATPSDADKSDEYNTEKDTVTYKPTTTEEVVEVDVNWVLDGETAFSTEKAGEFIYTAELKDATYIVADSVSLPTITAKVVMPEMQTFSSFMAPRSMIIDGTTATVDTFADLKTAMENPDITDVYLGAAITEQIDTDMSNSAAIQVARLKTLHLTQNINITQLNTSSYSSLFTVGTDDRLFINGTGTIKFSPVLSGSANAVVYATNNGEVTISGGATLESRSTATNAFGNAIWAEGNSIIDISTSSTLIGTRGEDNSKNPTEGYALLLDGSANVTIKADASSNLARSPEFIVNNLPSVTGTNPSVKIEDTATATISAGVFNGIKITNGNSLSSTKTLADYVKTGSYLANYTSKAAVELTATEATEKVAIAYKITFDANGGTFGSDTTVTQYTVDSEVGAFPATEPTRSDYDFVGYNTHAISENGTNIGTNRSLYADTTYYAVWSETSGTYSVSAPSVDFGTIKEGEATPSSETITITNNGTGNLTNLRVNSTDYTVTFASTNLNSGLSTDMTITPKATAQGNHSTSLLIFANESTSSIGNVPVTFEITEGTYSISADPTTVDLGTIKEGETLPSKDVTITNTGTATLNNLRVNTANYTVTFDDTSIANGESATMTVTPKNTVTAVADYDTTLSIFADGASSSVGSVAVIFSITEGTYSVSANPTSLNFNSIAEGETLPTEKTVTITNNGTVDLTGLEVTSSKYDITFDDTDLAKDAHTTMRITPKYTLTEGIHDETLYIRADETGSSVGSVPVTFEITAETHTLTVVNGTGGGNFVTGYGATITADAPEAGKFFDKWTVASGSATIQNTNSATTTVVIGSGDATVTASYKDTPQKQFSPELDEVAFADLVVGYSSAKDIMFGVQNTGSVTITTDEASATLTGEDSTSFTLDDSQISGGISAGGWKYITITPKLGLSTGTYEANIQITGTGIETVNIPVSLEVVDATTYELQITPNPHTFANATVGYSPITAEIFTIRSVGSGAVQSLEVTLSDTSKFTLDIDTDSMWGGFTAAQSGRSTNFRLNPNDDLGVGTHTVNILIDAREETALTGTPMTQISIPVSFTVLSDGSATVSSVDVTPTSAIIEKGNTKDFNVIVNGTGAITQEVDWTVEGASDSTIDTNGLLTVGASETATTITVRATSKVDNSKSGTAIVTVTTPVPTALSGTATITGTAKYGEILTADTSGITNNTGTFSYQWKRGTTDIGTNSSTYTLVEADIGKTITVEITSSVQTGTITSSATATVEKADGAVAPSEPTLDSKTHNSITVNTVAGQEYRIGTTGAWQTTGTFSSLSANTSYDIYTRIKETATTKASAISTALSVTTNTAPVTNHTITYNANGGTGTQANGSATDSVAFTFPTTTTFNAPIGKQFKGWALTSTATTVITSSTFTTDDTVYAIWENIPVTNHIITYNANGGTGTQANGSATDSVAFTFPATTTFNAPVGKQFKGWALTSTATTVITSSTFTADDTVYAIWEFAPLTGTATIDDTTPAIGETLTASLTGTNNTGTLSYQWKRGTTNVGTNSDTYQVVAADVGSKITVTITSSEQTGAITSAETAPATDPSKTDQTLSFAPTGIIATVGDTTVTEPTLSGDMTTVTYTSGNIKVATVNPTSGEVTIVGAGTAVITANAKAEMAGGVDYNAGTASYTLTVNAGTITAGSDETTVFEGDYAKLESVKITVGGTTTTLTQVGNKLTGYTGYTFNGGVVGEVNPGSIAVTLYKEFLATLPAGGYTLEITLTGGVSAGTVTATIPGKTNHTISVSNAGSGTKGNLTNNYGDIVAITAGSRSGYTFSGWTVGAGAATIDNANAANTDIVVLGDGTITANWTKNSTGDSGSTGSSGSGSSSSGGSSVTYYDIKITQEGKGKITPDGGYDDIETVRRYYDKTFEFKAEDGYVISDVLVNGKSVGIVSSYTFKDVTKDQTLKVIFTKAVENPETGGKENPNTGAEITPTPSITPEIGTDTNTNTTTTESGSSFPMYLIIALVAIAGTAGILISRKRKGETQE